MRRCPIFLVENEIFHIGHIFQSEISCGLHRVGAAIERFHNHRSRCVVGIGSGSSEIRFGNQVAIITRSPHERCCALLHWVSHESHAPSKQSVRADSTDDHTCSTISCQSCSKCACVDQVIDIVNVFGSETEAECGLNGVVPARVTPNLDIFGLQDVKVRATGSAYHVTRSSVDGGIAASDMVLQ